MGRGHVLDLLPYFCLPPPHTGGWASHQLLSTLTSSFVQFLKRNPTHRIGGGPGDAADVQVSLVLSHGIGAKG